MVKRTFDATVDDPERRHKDKHHKRKHREAKEKHEKKEKRRKDKQDVVPSSPFRECTTRMYIQLAPCYANRIQEGISMHLNKHLLR